MKSFCRKSTLAAVLSAVALGVFAMERSVDSSGKVFEYVKNDPFSVRIYKLENGLTVFLSKNPRTPTVAVSVTVRAGSTDESPRSTGLAHYFEHMMFKGTPRLGALNWEKEKVLLKQIESLFEEHRNTADPKKKADIYKKIDALSAEAAKYASTGEFSKLASHLGADKLNAMTSYDMTAYVAEVPANELAKYLKLDSERFTEPVMRLFHTELESVYEEFNLIQNKDSSRAFFTVMKNLFPKHPFGRQIIGLPEHLKNPSMRDINAFRRKYYVPNNMAVILVGDLDYRKALEAVEDSFGKLPASGDPVRSTPVEKSLPPQQTFTVTGPEPAQVISGFRIRRTPRTVLMMLMLSRMLADNGYGLLEQNLQLPRKLQSASAFPFTERDYAAFFLIGMPKKGQSLKEVESLMRGELQRVADGQFEDWRMSAVAANIRVSISDMREGENMDVAQEIAELFAACEPYSNFSATADLIAGITQKELSDFAKELLKSSVTVYKEQGKPVGLLRVAKPLITPVPLNAEKSSVFAEKFSALPPSPPVKPEFPDPGKIFSSKKLPSGILLRYDTRRVKSDLFCVRFFSDYTKFHDRKLNFALGYMDHVGTDQYTPATLRQEFYKLGVKFSFATNRDGTFAEIYGPDENFEKAIRLFMHFLEHAKPDSAAYKRYVASVQRVRSNEKLNQKTAFYRLFNYARYGKDHPFAFLLSDAEMAKTEPAELIDLVRRTLTASNISFVYSGPAGLERVMKTVSEITPRPPLSIGKAKKYMPAVSKQPTVYLLDFDNTRLMVGFSAAGKVFDKDRTAVIELFNEYFGFGLDSVVFQEIRESRALAYNAGAVYAASDLVGRRDMLFGLIQTQPSKLFDAIPAMQGILSKMPVSIPKFMASKAACVKQTQTRRYLDMDLFDYELRLKRMGAVPEWRKDLYSKLTRVTMKDVEKFFNENVSEAAFDLIVIGRISAADKKKLEKFGKVVEVSLSEIYGY